MAATDRRAWARQPSCLLLLGGTLAEESSFTSVIQKFTLLKVQASHSESEEFVDSVEKYIVKLSEGKLFIHKYKIFAKNSTKLEKLRDIAPYASSWIAFMKAEGIPVHVELELLALKVEFVAHENERWEGKFDHLEGLGLERVLKDAAHANDEDMPTQIDTWLRATLFQTLSSVFENMDVQMCDKYRPLLLQDIEIAIERISRLSVANEMATVSEDLHALAVMFKAGLPNSNVVAAEAAMAADALKTPRFALLKGALEKSAAALEYQAGILELLKRGSSDQLGDARLVLALDAFADPAMFGCLAEAADNDASSKVSFTNCNLVLCGERDERNLYEVLSEISQYAMDALELWSPLRKHEKLDELLHLMRLVGDAMIGADIVLSAALRQLAEPLLDNQKISNPTIEDFEIVLAEVDQNFKVCEYESVFAEGGHLDKCLRDFLKRYTNISNALKTELPAVHTVMIDSIKACITNAEARLLCAKTLRAMLGMERARRDTHSQGLGDFWTESGSLCPQILDFVDVGAQLRVSEGFLFDHDIAQQSDQIRFCNAAEDIAVVSMHDATSWPSALARAQVYDVVESTLKKSALKFVCAFLQSCEWEGIANVVASQTSDSDFEKMSVHGVVSTVASPEKMEQSTKRAVRCFKSGIASDPAMLSSNATHAMMERVLKVSAIKSLLLTDVLVVGSTEVPIDDVLAMTLLMKSTHEMCSALLFFYSETKKTTADCLVKHEVRGDLLKCLDFVCSVARDCAAHVEAHGNMYKSIEAAATWKWGTQNSLEWRNSAILVVTELRSRVYMEAYKDMLSISKNVEKFTPRHHHICNDTTFAKALVKTNLVKNVNKDLLGSVTVDLFKSMAQLSRLASELGLQDPKVDPKTKEGVEICECCFKGGRLALLIIAGANTVMNLTGPQQIEEASNLLNTKRREMPKTLVAALEDVVAKRSAASSSKQKAIPVGAAKLKKEGA